MASLLSTLTRLTIFLGMSAAWVASLWFVFRLDFSHHSLLSLASWHALPPLSLWGGWRLWRQRAQSAKRDAEAAAEAREAAERQTQHDSARKAYAAQMRLRHFAIDCRWARIASESLTDAALSNMAGEVAPLSLPAEQKHLHLAEGIASVLDELYAECPEARGLPVYLASHCSAAREQLAQRTQVISALPLNCERGVAAAMLACFEREPLLGGAVFIAAESAIKPAEGSQIDRFTLSSQQQDSVVVLLMTHPILKEALSSQNKSGATPSSSPDAMTPFWDRSFSSDDADDSAGLPRRVVDALLDMPVRGQVHRPSVVASGKPRMAWQTAMEQALINADLKALPFVWEVTPQAEPPTKSAEPEINCAWVAHNAGRFEQAGDHLAALGGALNHFDIDLNLIRQGSNVLAEVDLGAMDSWTSLALAVSRTHSLGEVTLWAAFGKQSSLGFIRPSAHLGA